MSTTPARASVGRPRTFDRHHVIDVAMDGYWSEGIEGLSLNEICRRASVSKPGMYREFGSEDGLMDAALEQYAELVLVPNFERMTDDLPFSDTLASMIELMTDADRAGPAGCLLAKMQQSPSRLGPATSTRVASLRAAARAAYAEWVDQAKESSEIDSSIPTAVAAALIDIQCTTLLVQMSLGEDPEMLRSQARLAFAGLLTQPGPP